MNVTCLGCFVSALGITILMGNIAQAQVQRETYDASGNVVARTTSSDGLPQILGQPQLQVVQPGEFASFSVVLADTRSLSYQWRFGGTNIPTATNDALLLLNVSTANQGIYSVVVSNSSGSVTSTPAALYIDSDGDGLPDSWEISNWGNLATARGAGDADGDGISNLDEFLDGTNPNSSASFLRRLNLSGDGGGSVAVNPTKLSYTNGENVTLSATPFSPNSFYGWAGDLITSSNPAPLTMNGNKSVRGRFLCTPPPAGMVAFWRGETDATDLVGGHHGTFYNGTSPTGPSVTTTGKVGAAFDFTGSIHVRVPDSADLWLPRITLEAWVYPTSVSGIQTVLARGSATGQDGAWRLVVINGTPRFITRHANNSTHDLQPPTSAAPLSVNQWTHLAASFDGQTKQLYVNGRLANSASGLAALFYESAVIPETIGANWANNGPAQGFIGRVDEACIYSRAFRYDEVDSIYLADLAGKCLSGPCITSRSQLPDGLPGVAYSQQVTAALGTAPITFSLSAGSLPAGLSLSASGTISGIPTTPGNYVFAVLATDENGLSSEQVFGLRIVASVSPPGLVAWWRAENNAQDAAGANHGTLRNGAAFAAGKVGQAFSFDGIDDYIDVADATQLRPAQITVECWAYPTAQTTVYQTILARGSPNNADDAWWLGVLSGKPQFWSKHITGGMNLLEGPAILPLNEWTHLAISFDGMTKRLYVNGTMVASTGPRDALVYEAGAVPVTIGANWVNNVAAQRFTGRVDEASLFNRALSDAEIASIHAAGPAGKASSGPYINGPSLLPAAVVAQSYSQTFTSIRGTAPIAFSLSGGALPPGLTLSSAGLLSGTPTTPGDFAFIVRAADAVAQYVNQARTLRVLPRVPPPSGLVAWWKAEANTQDSAGANHGTLRNGTTFASGNVGQAFALDGVDDSIDIPDASALRPASVTLEAWVLFSVVDSRLRHIFAKPLGSGTSDSYGMWLDGSILRAAVADNSGGLSVSYSWSPTAGRWYHLAYTFDDATKQQALYVDGRQVASGLALKTIAYDNQPVLLGRDIENASPAFFLAGRIDEAAIYNRALSASEINSIYKADSGGKASAGPYFITLPALPDAAIGQGYTQAVVSVRGTAPVTYGLVGGILPAGIALSPAGVLNGVPSAIGSFLFTVRATDAAGLFAEQQFTVNAYQRVATPAGVVSWWWAENNALDSIGRNHGSLANGATFAAGRIGQGFSLDGLNDAIEAPDSPSLRPVSVTLEAWVAFYATNNFRTIFAKPVGSGSSDSFSLYLENGIVRGLIGNSSGNGSAVSALMSPVLGQWYHVAYTFDGLRHQQALYINGLQVASGSESRSIGYDTQPLLLGRDTEFGSPAFFFQGRIDEATIYNRALDASEIGLVFSAGSLGKITIVPYTGVLRWSGSPGDSVLVEATTDFQTWEEVLVMTVASDGNIYFVDPDAHRYGERFYRARSAPPAYINTFIVTSTSDNGSGSLRQAILDANASPGGDRIHFDIPGGGVKTIAPLTALPVITGPVLLDGYTQPGSSPNTFITGDNAVLRIHLTGTNAGNGANGLQFATSNSTVRGLTISRFRGNCIRLDLNGNHVIQGNFLDVDPTGTTAMVNGPYSIHVNRSSHNLIGGTTPDARNLIFGLFLSFSHSNVVEGNYVGAAANGLQPIGGYIDVEGSHGNRIGGGAFGAGNIVGGPFWFYRGSSSNRVQGNFIGVGADGVASLGSDIHRIIFDLDAGTGNIIGTDADGLNDANEGNIIARYQFEGIRLWGGDFTVVAGNKIGTDHTGTLALGGSGYGISMDSSDGNVIGGLLPVQRNLISGNARAIGLSMGISNKILGNYIGTTASGTGALGNGSGITLAVGAQHTLIASNVIAFNGGSAVVLWSGAGSRNAILGNAIHSNTGLGIDLGYTFGGSTVVTPNDPGDMDTGPNNLQNFPVLTSAVAAGVGTTIQGTLASAPSQAFRIEFLGNSAPDPSGFGEGEFYLGATEVITDGSGNASFSVLLTSVPDSLSFFTATATDSAGNTSEFSAYVQRGP
jgi:hypothetical protein